LFIAGYLRSGSTLLERLLGQLDGITAAGELRYIWINGLLQNHLCGCGAPFRSCPFWREVIEEAFGGFDRVDAVRLVRLQRSIDHVWNIPQMLTSVRLPRFGRFLREYLSHLEPLYGAIRRIAGASVIVDSSKAPSHGLILRASPGLDVDVVHLVRDSRAVAHSWGRVRVKPEVHWERRYMPRYGPARSAFEWDVMNLAAPALKLPPGSYLRLRYEDLATDPSRSVSRVLSAVGEPSRPLDFLQNGTARLRPDHTISGNPMRFETGPVQIAPDEAWRTTMSRADVRLVTALTWPLLRRYGYD